MSNTVRWRDYLRDPTQMFGIAIIVLSLVIVLSSEGFPRTLAAASGAFVLGVVYQGYWTEVFKVHSRRALDGWDEALRLMRPTRSTSGKVEESPSDDTNAP